MTNHPSKVPPPPSGPALAQRRVAVGGSGSARPVPKEAMRIVSMRLPTSLVVDLKRLAQAHSGKYQALARSVLSEFVAEREKASAEEA